MRKITSRTIKENGIRLKEKSKEIGQHFRKQTIGYILGGFGLVAGLAWDEAIKSIIDHFFPGDKETIWAKLSYAILITVFVVLIGIYLNRLIKEKKL